MHSWLLDSTCEKHKVRKYRYYYYVVAWFENSHKRLMIAAEVGRDSPIETWEDVMDAQGALADKHNLPPECLVILNWRRLKNPATS